jgi:hypothetical protein
VVYSTTQAVVPYNKVELEKMCVMSINATQFQLTVAPVFARMVVPLGPVVLQTKKIS